MPVMARASQRQLSHPSPEDGFIRLHARSASERAGCAWATSISHRQFKPCANLGERPVWTYETQNVALAPAHQHHLLVRCRHCGSPGRVVGEDAGHLRQVADVAVHSSEEGGDRGLVRRDAIKVTKEPEIRGRRARRRASDPASSCRSGAAHARHEAYARFSLPRLWPLPGSSKCARCDRRGLQPRNHRYGLPRGALLVEVLRIRWPSHFPQLANGFTPVHIRVPIKHQGS
jgi:hypothetical protein